MFIVTFDGIAHWWTNFENSFYTFQVVMYPNGEFYFNYLDLQGDYSSATIGMQNQNGSDALVMGYDNTDALLDNNFSISVKQEPSWIELSNNQGNLSQGEGANVSVSLSAQDLSNGSYSGYLFINTNAQDVTIPIVLTVSDEPQLLGDINNDGLLNIQDIVIIVSSYILEGLYSDIADMNQDGTLNVLDVIILVGIIIN